MAVEPEWETIKGFVSGVAIKVASPFGKVAMPFYVTNFQVDGQPVEFMEVVNPFKRPVLLNDGEFVALAGFTHGGLYRAEYLGLPIQGRLPRGTHIGERQARVFAVVMAVAALVLASSSWAVLTVPMVAISLWCAAEAGSMRRASRLIAELVRPPRSLA